MDNTLLYSATEMATLRVNKKAQRQLEIAQQQMELERSYVCKDWNRRMRTFMSQKKRYMPKTGWDTAAYRKQAERPSHSATTLNGAKLPRTWILQNSYTKYSDGRVVPRPLTQQTPNVRRPVTTTNSIPHPDVTTTRALSAPPGARRLHTGNHKLQSHMLSDRPRPAQPFNFLVTQLGLDDDTLNVATDDDDDVFIASLDNSKDSTGSRKATEVQLNGQKLKDKPRKSAHNSSIAASNYSRSSYNLPYSQRSRTATNDYLSVTDKSQKLIRPKSHTLM